jgi:hypothetical protein
MHLHFSDYNKNLSGKATNKTFMWRRTLSHNPNILFGSGMTHLSCAPLQLHTELFNIAVIRVFLFEF